MSFSVTMPVATSASGGRNWAPDSRKIFGAAGRMWPVVGAALAVAVGLLIGCGRARGGCAGFEPFGGARNAAESTSPRASAVWGRDRRGRRMARGDGGWEELRDVDERVKVRLVLHCAAFLLTGRRPTRRSRARERACALREGERQPRRGKGVHSLPVANKSFWCSSTRTSPSLSSCSRPNAQAGRMSGALQGK